MDTGFDSVQLSSYQRIAEQAAHPNEKSHQPQVCIEGVTNQTVLSYMNYLGANDFDALIELFALDGALQPPFQSPVVGKENLLKFFQEEGQDLKLMPKRGISEPAEEEGYTQIRVTGQVRTSWFSAGVWINVAWKFLLNSENKISSVAVDLLASPQELLNFVR